MKKTMLLALLAFAGVTAFAQNAPEKKRKII